MKAWLFLSSLLLSLELRNFNIVQVYWPKWLQTKVFPLSSLWVFIFPLPNYCLCRKKFSLEQNCPSFAIGNETFHMTAILTPDSYYHHSHYVSNPLSLRSKSRACSTIHTHKSLILISSYQFHVVYERVSMLPCVFSITTQLHSINFLNHLTVLLSSKSSNQSNPKSCQSTHIF